MEEQIYRLEKALEERNCQLESSASTSKELEKQRRTDQELKKRVLKLEFCLQEARAQTQKLQRMGEHRDKALKELHEQLAARQQVPTKGHNEKQNFREISGFKVVASMSMLILVVLSKW